MDFRNASRLFADKDFDGNPEVVIEVPSGGEIPTGNEEPPNGNDIDPKSGQGGSGDNPGGGQGNGGSNDDEKTDDVKNVENISFGCVDKNAQSARNYYK